MINGFRATRTPEKRGSGDYYTADRDGRMVLFEGETGQIHKPGACVFIAQNDLARVQDLVTGKVPGKHVRIGYVDRDMDGTFIVMTGVDDDNKIIQSTAKPALIVIDDITGEAESGIEVSLQPRRFRTPYIEWQTGLEAGSGVTGHLGMPIMDLFSKNQMGDSLALGHVPVRRDREAGFVYVNAPIRKEPPVKAAPKKVLILEA